MLQKKYPINTSRCRRVLELGSIEGKAPKVPQKVTPIKSLHEFTFSSTTVKVHRVSGIGQGHTITLNPDNLKFENRYQHKIVNEHQLDQRGKPKKFTLNPMPGATELQENFAEPSGQVLFDCKLNNDCQAEFASIDELRLHQDGGCYRKEPLPVTGETMQDFIKKINIAEMGITGRSDFYHESDKGPLYHRQTISEINLPEHLLLYAKDTRWSLPGTGILENLGMGFALPLPTHKNKILQRPRDFVEKIFAAGAGAGGDQRNATAAEIVQRMRREETRQGLPLFQPNEYLDVQQVKYLIYQLGQKLKAGIRPNPDPESLRETESDATVQDTVDLENAEPEPIPVDEEQEQIDEDHAIAVMDAFEEAAVMDNAIDFLEVAERNDRDESENHPFVIFGVPLCDLAKTILMKKRGDLSPLQYLDDETIKNIASTVGTIVLSQELVASQKTKEAKFKDVEQTIVQFVKNHCPCTTHLQLQP